jgi:hypothetical protein
MNDVCLDQNPINTEFVGQPEAKRLLAKNQGTTSTYGRKLSGSDPSKPLPDSRSHVQGRSELLQVIAQCQKELSRAVAISLTKIWVVPEFAGSISGSSG